MSLYRHRHTNRTADAFQYGKQDQPGWFITLVEQKLVIRHTEGFVWPVQEKIRGVNTLVEVLVGDWVFRFTDGAQETGSIKASQFSNYFEPVPAEPEPAAPADHDAMMREVARDGQGAVQQFAQLYVVIADITRKHEGLQKENQDLAQWQQSMLAEEAKLDLHAIASSLGATAGTDVRTFLQARLPGIIKNWQDQASVDPQMQAIAAALDEAKIPRKVQRGFFDVELTLLERVNKLVGVATTES